MAITLPDLPYPKNALTPHISEETLDYHYGKHHNAYVTNLNKLIEGTPDAGKSLEELIRSASGGLFNNAAQVWNHTFYWHSMRPGGGGAPSGEVASAVDDAFGSYDQFRGEFAAVAATQFGSGWTWLIADGGKLSVAKTGNADSPLVQGKKALLTIDVWEHAYYIDYRNARPKYIETFLDSLLNWEFVAKNLKDA